MYVLVLLILLSMLCDCTVMSYLGIIFFSSYLCGMGILSSICEYIFICTHTHTHTHTHTQQLSVLAVAGE
jgi:hypothetical protein